MKWPYLNIVVMACALTFTACSTTGNSSSRMPEDNSKTVRGDEVSLEDYLRRISGVRVTGSGSNLRVNIRANKEPLYELNGHIIGNRFSEVYALVSHQSIVSVEAIPPAKASLYGIRGANGVIVILTE